MHTRKTLLVNLLFSTLLLLNPVTGWSNTQKISEQTQSLLQYAHNLKTQIKTNAKTIANIRTLIKARQQTIFTALSESKNLSATSKVMTYLLPKHIVQLFPKDMRAYLEKETSLKGTLEIRSATTPDKKEYFQYLIHVDDKPIYLNFADNIPRNLHTGDEIQIRQAFLLTDSTGLQRIVLHADNLKVIKSNLAINDAFGPQNTVVIAVNFQDRPNEKPWTTAALNELVIRKMNDIFYESSFRQTTVIGTSIGWYTLAINSNTNCENMVNQIRTLSQSAAAQAGVDLSPYKRRMYVFPYTAACSFGGLGSIGSNGNFSEAWINGAVDDRVPGHEFGHNFGLYHSNYLRCSTGTESGNCTVSEYMDNTDIMGNAMTGHFNAYQKDRLGWLNYQTSPPLTTVSTSGNYLIDAYAAHNNNSKGLKILKTRATDGSSDYYYLEFRQGIGFDRDLAACGNNCDYTNGVVIHTGNSVNGNSSRVLDMTPDGNPNKIALLQGRSYSNPAAANGGVTFTVNSISTTGAMVNVQFGNTNPPPVICERMAPTISITPSTTQWVRAGSTTNYNITLRNNDTASCSATTYYLKTSATTSLIQIISDTTSVILNPGASSQTTMALMTNAAIPTGIYAASLTMTNSMRPSVSASAVVNLGINP